MIAKDENTAKISWFVEKVINENEKEKTDIDFFTKMYYNLKTNSFLSC